MKSVGSLPANGIVLFIEELEKNKIKKQKKKRKINMIERIDDLKNYFFDSKDSFNDSIYVSTNIRKKWMLNQEKTVQQGIVCDINFTNKGGGVWEAKLCKT